MTSTPTDDWESGFRALTKFAELKGHASPAGRVHAFGIDLGGWVARRRIAYWDGTLPADESDLLENLPGWTWGKPRRKSWRAALSALSTQLAKRPDLDLSQALVIDGIDLLAWAHDQRTAHHNGELSETQILLLEALPAWKWDNDTVRWETGLCALETYLREHGTADVPRTARTNGFDVGAWAHRCKEEHRAGTLSADRIAELTRLPGWRWGRASDAWIQGISAIETYTAIHGTATPRQSEVLDGFSLGQWVHHRRRDYKTGTLTAEKISALESLPGWDWDPFQSQWERGFSALTQFAEHSGHAQPPKSAVIGTYPLGEWVSTQRKHHHRGILSETRSARLEQLPNWRWIEQEQNT
ncbi:MAG: helicase associated domain-containing protein [Rhodococcus sp. (in: high G+C Gram-positive bacteria)]|uniref:helicase associated domain-containing protein n=1 Tax=Rhodococcus sp. TaxID=1831 RepID=UPI002AD6862A|nr:helicase associated domain-containing protein [Rhodococcus sp. (in: high G+C Gram-positive bacteria)]